MKNLYVKPMVQVITFEPREPLSTVDTEGNWKSGNIDYSQSTQ